MLLANAPRWSHAPGNPVVPSRWQATTPDWNLTLSQLLDQEISTWWTVSATDPSFGVSQLSNEQRCRAMAFLLLLAPSDEDAAVRVLRRVPDLRDETEGTLRNLARWAASLYASEESSHRPLYPVEFKPALLADWFVVGALLDRPPLVEAAVADLTQEEAVAFIGRLFRACEHTKAASLLPAFLERPGDISAILNLLITNTLADGQLDQPVAAAFTDKWSPTDEQAQKLDDALARGRLPHVRVALAGFFVSRARQRQGGVDVALWLDRLNTRCRDAERYEQGLAAGREAVSISRRLAAEKSAARRADLAACVTNLAETFRAAGRYTEALGHAKEAAALLRRLRETSHAFDAAFALALLVLGNAFLDAGRRPKALAVAHEARDLFRSQAEAGKADASLSLAEVLCLMSEIHFYDGHIENSLLAIQQAVNVLRGLGDDRDVQLGLRNCLLLLAKAQVEVESFPLALLAAEESVEISRELVVREPALHRAKLAEALSSLSNRLCENGKTSRAVAPGQEAVAICRRLVRDRPGYHEVGLILALSCLSIRLRGSDDVRAGLLAAEEAVSIARELVPFNAATIEPHLAQVLIVLGGALIDAKQLTSAVEVVDESLSITRRLSRADPERYAVRLAMDLRSLGALYCQVGDHPKELAAVKESVQVLSQFRRLDDRVRALQEAGANAIRVVLANHSSLEASMAYQASLGRIG